MFVQDGAFRGQPYNVVQVLMHRKGGRDVVHAFEGRHIQTPTWAASYGGPRNTLSLYDSWPFPTASLTLGRVIRRAASYGGPRSAISYGALATLLFSPTLGYAGRETHYLVTTPRPHLLPLHRPRPRRILYNTSAAPPSLRQSTVRFAPSHLTWPKLAKRKCDHSYITWPTLAQEDVWPVI